MKKHLVFLAVILFTFTTLDSYAFQKNDKKKAKERKEQTIPRKYRKYKTKEAKFEAAKKFYNKGMYLSAIDMFEQVYPLYMGTDKGDSALFLFADSYYKNEDYLMSSYLFDDFTKKYPYSSRAEKAAFLSAKSHYNNIPSYNLDQTDAYFAKEGLENFLEYYPRSEYTDECNKMLDTLREQLAHKAYSIAYMYYNIGQYAAAQISFKNILLDFPSSKYTEKALITLVKNNYEYALKSIESKQAERFQAAIDSKDQLKAKFPDSEYLDEAEKIAKDAAKRRDKILVDK